MSYTIQYISAGLSGAAHGDLTFETLAEAEDYRRGYDSAMFTAVWPRAIDPADCGCTECLTGEYVPLNQASREQILQLARGKLGNNTGWYLTEPGVVEINVRFGDRITTFSPDELDLTVGNQS